MNALLSPWSCLAVALLAGGCQPEPELACERVRFGWPLLDLSPSVDVDDLAEGLQVSFDVRSDLLAGAHATLTIAAGDQDPVYAAQAQAQEDGLLSFQNVTVPEGEIVFFLDARDGCGGHRSGLRTFVWDGLGYPGCHLQLAMGPSQDPESLYPVLGPEHDENVELPGMQVRVLVDAGRPDMRVRLFATDRETGEAQSYDLAPDASGVAEQELTLGAGEQAMRAVCFWDAQDLRPSSPTWTYWVQSGE